MEFPVNPNPSGEISYLDKDDINGPGLQKYIKRTGDTSVDFALYKISQFSASGELSERLRFAKELDELALQLGVRNLPSLSNVVKRLVDEDSVEVRVELASQIPVLARVLVQDFDAYAEVVDWLIPCLDCLLEDKRQEVLKAACAAATALAETLTKEDRGSLILTMILRILHNEDEDTRIRALNALKDLIALLTSDICEWYIVKEAMILSSENVVKVRKAVAECIPRLSRQVQQAESFEKLMKIFQELSRDSIWGVRKACVENISEMFEGLNCNNQEVFVMPLFLELLNDKSNSVRQCAMLQLGPCIFNCKVQVPEEVIMMYTELARNSGNKGEFQYHCAYYFPAVMIKLGRGAWDRMSTAFVYLVNEADTRAKKCLISSIHEIGKVLEPDLATAELIPLFESVFNESIASKQLAIGALARFLAVILPDTRIGFLKYIRTMHKLTTNWRIRQAIAKQLYEFVRLYEIEIVESEILPIVVTLADDKISKVRENAAVSMGKIVNYLIASAERHPFIEVFRQYSNGPSWKKTVFAIACQELVSQDRFPEIFGKELQKLCEEKAPNIRICCGKVIRIGREIQKSSHYWIFLEQKLSHDFDADVRYEVIGKYDVERGVSKMRPNNKKAAELMPPMFRALFPDDDLQEIINFSARNSASLAFGMLKTSTTPAMNGFVEELFLQSVNRQKMLIDF